MSDDECELCDGCGEVTAKTTRAELDQIGCPACIERELHERINLATAERDGRVSVELLQIERDTADRLRDDNAKLRAERDALARDIERHLQIISDTLAECDAVKNPTPEMISRGADVMVLHLFGSSRAMTSDREAFEFALREALASTPCVLAKHRNDTS